MKTRGCGTQKTMTPELLSEMAAGGMNRQQVADYFGITVRRFNQILKQREDLLSAFNTGIAEGIKVATDALMDRIKDGNIVAILFYLKARAGWVEEQYRKEKPDENSIPQPVIYLPDNGRDHPQAVTE